MSRPRPLAPTVVANLTAPLLVELAARFERSGLERPATMVLSGLLAGEAERVASAWSAAGLEVARSGSRGTGRRSC